MKSIEPWLSLVATSVAIGLGAYQAAISTGANNRSAVITGVIAALGAAQGHFRSGPLDSAASSPTAPNSVTAAPTLTFTPTPGGSAATTANGKP